MSSRRLLGYVLLAENSEDNSTETEYDISELEDDWEDPCQEFNHSILFFLTIITAFIGWVLYGWLIYVRRPTLTGSDVIFILLFINAAIRFGPKLWGALQIHGVHHVSQTGCKLVAYTEFGLRHVNTALVISIVIYAWILVFHPQYDIDSMIKTNFAWILIAIFVIEGVTGMVPAIYTDVDDKWERCDFTHTESVNLRGFLAAQIFLSTVLPYIVPFLAIIYPLVKLSKSMLDIEEENMRDCTIRSVLVVWTHIALSLPWALHALVMLPLIQGWNVGSEAITVCVIDGVFRLFLEGWYAITPFIVIFGDRELRKNLPGSSYVVQFLWTIKGLCRR